MIVGCVGLPGDRKKDSEVWELEGALAEVRSAHKVW